MQKAKERLKVLALLMVCMGIPIIAWDLTRIVRGEPGVATPDPTYAELVAIVLTAVTVVLATLAIVIAILAVWGYKSIKDEAGLVAKRAVDSKVDQAVKAHITDESLERHVAKEIRRRVDTLGLERSRYAKAFELPDNSQQGSVGAVYPKDESNDERQAGR